MASPTNTIRRSVSLPPDLVSEAVKSAPPALKGNFNRLVRTALEEYIQSRKARAFASEMQAIVMKFPGINFNDRWAIMQLAIKSVTVSIPDRGQKTVNELDCL